MSLPVLDLQDLSIDYGLPAAPLHAVRNVSLQIAAGESYGLIGESGSGKTSVAYAILNYLRGGRITGGSIRIAGQDVLALSPKELTRLRGNKAAMVYQDPMTSLNPSIKVGHQIAESLIWHRNLPGDKAWRQAVDLLERVHLPDPEALARRYPHQLSGGQQQRVVIALAMACAPDLLILDEPTTGLDVTTQAVVLDLVDELRRESGSAVLFISHNLGVVAQTCDRIGVLYAGELVEENTAAEIVARPAHPYTAGLLAAMPRTRGTQGDLASIPGSLPDLRQVPEACIFAPRCAIATETCHGQRPEARHLAPAHRIRCLHPGALPAQVAGAAALPRDLTAVPPVLSLEDIRCTFRQRQGLPLLGRVTEVRAVDGVSLSVPKGGTLAVVGESGSGKSTLARIAIGLQPASGGEIRLGGAALDGGAGARPRSQQRRMQMIFQNPDGALNPQLTVAEIIARPLKLYGLADGDLRPRVEALLERVRLAPRYADRLPHELSGGEKQRVNIARVLAAEPEVIICDEPTSALDISVQASVLNQLRDLQRQIGVSYLFISHDLAVVRHISDEVAVIFRGRVVEQGPTARVFAGPNHPYTDSLLAALPEIDRPRQPVPQVPPLAAPATQGCAFVGRCKHRIAGLCETQAPTLTATGDGRAIACHHSLEVLARLQAETETETLPELT